MAASILRKSLKNQLFSAARITTNLTKPTINSTKPTLTSPLSLPYQIPCFLEKGTVDSNLNVGFFPSFSFGHFLNPVSPNGLVTVDQDRVFVDESKKIWADSVKKKRKKKMNKHKLKKLRKRLRRKTKT